MTSAAVAAALRRIRETNSPPALAALTADLRRAHPDDADAETVARQAELKRRRLASES